MGLSDRVNEGMGKVDCAIKWLVGSFGEMQQVCQRRVEGAMVSFERVSVRCLNDM